jgi:DNA-binding transcriptional LysR family regulator
MELRQLDLFRILAYELSFTRAARRAHCVQSNVTVQIRNLEAELGVPLFERLGKGVRLTSHGQRLLPYAEHVQQLLMEGTAAAIGENRPTGNLAIGSPESVLTYRLPPVLLAYRASFPDVSLTLSAMGNDPLVTQLEQGKLDLALVIDDPLRFRHLRAEILCEERLVLLAPPSHRLATRPAIEASALREETFLLTDSERPYRAKLERVLAREGGWPQSIMEFSSVEAIKQCAVLGMGIACLPAIVAAPEIASGKLAVLPWETSGLTMLTQAVWHKDKWLSPAIEAFLTLLRDRLVPHSKDDRLQAVLQNGDNARDAMLS